MIDGFASLKLDSEHTSQLKQNIIILSLFFCVYSANANTLKWHIKFHSVIQSEQ